MDLLLAIFQAAGLGLAVGVGGPLAALFVATMAHLGLGIDPEGTDWEFFASNWFIVLMFAANVAAFYAQRSGLAARPDAFRAGAAGFATLVGAIAGAASLAEEDEPALLGLVIAGLLALAASLLASEVLLGAQRRAAAEHEAAPVGTLALIFALTGIVIAALALFVPPSAIVVAGALATLALGRRRRAGEKYEGLRILR